MKACFAAIVVIQSVIAVFIFQHFWDDCKEVFSGGPTGATRSASERSRP